MTDTQNLTRAQVAAVMDATLLKPEATHADVDKLVAEAAQLGCGAVCVSPSMLPVTRVDFSDATNSTSTPAVATVVGFPSGKHATLVKATEARFAVEHGAVEVDVGWISPRPSSVMPCLLYTSPSPRDLSTSRMPSSA